MERNCRRMSFSLPSSSLHCKVMSRHVTCCVYVPTDVAHWMCVREHSRTRASSDHVTGSIHLIGSQGNHKYLFRFFFECLFFLCGLLPPLPPFTQPFGEPRNGARCVVCVRVCVCVWVWVCVYVCVCECVCV